MFYNKTFVHIGIVYTAEVTKKKKKLPTTMKINNKSFGIPCYMAEMRLFMYIEHTATAYTDSLTNQQNRNKI